MDNVICENVCSSSTCCCLKSWLVGGMVRQARRRRDLPLHLKSWKRHCCDALPPLLFRFAHSYMLPCLPWLFYYYSSKSDHPQPKTPDLQACRQQRMPYACCAGVFPGPSTILPGGVAHVKNKRAGGDGGDVASFEKLPPPPPRPLPPHSTCHCPFLPHCWRFQHAMPFACGSEPGWFVLRFMER